VVKPLILPFQLDGDRRKRLLDGLGIGEIVGLDRKLSFLRVSERKLISRSGPRMGGFGGGVRMTAIFGSWH
jgi:hypothetical protein